MLQFNQSQNVAFPVAVANGLGTTVAAGLLHIDAPPKPHYLGKRRVSPAAGRTSMCRASSGPSLGGRSLDLTEVRLRTSEQTPAGQRTLERGPRPIPAAAWRMPASLWAAYALRAAISG